MKKPPHTLQALIVALHARHPYLTRDDARRAAMTILACWKEAVVRDRRVELRGFGVFYPTHRAAFVSDNPRTSARMEVAARTSVRFRASEQLLKRLN